ncbi:MAG: TauD/TfdA family dioxygenase [bacterium]
MSEKIEPKPRLKNLGNARRRGVSLSSRAQVQMAPLEEGQSLPLLVEPASDALNLPEWARDNRSLLGEKLLEHGGILFRGFKGLAADRLEDLLRALNFEPLEYRERSSPRRAVSGNVYTSTDYPPSYPIFLHNENSYQATWPLKIFFYCDEPAEEGGETPIADCRKVLEAIDPEIQDRFAKRGWMYVRNYGDGFGLDWTTVFQTEDRDRVDEYCRANGIETEWKSGGRLRTRAVRPAMTAHPHTGEQIWFNHATFFHVSTLVPEVRESLLQEFSEEDLPTNSFYGDGSRLEPEVMEHLREAYRQATVSFPWRRGDVLMLDNMLVAHGRAPFSGERHVLVAMAEPVSR